MQPPRAAAAASLAAADYESGWQGQVRGPSASVVPLNCSSVRNTSAGHSRGVHVFAGMPHFLSFAAAVRTNALLLFSGMRPELVPGVDRLCMFGQQPMSLLHHVHWR